MNLFIRLIFNYWKFFAMAWAAILLLSFSLLFKHWNHSVSHGGSLIDTDLSSVLPKYQDGSLKHVLGMIDKKRNQQLLLSVSFASNEGATKLLASRQALLEKVLDKVNASHLFSLTSNDIKAEQTKELIALLWDKRHQLLSAEDIRAFEDSVKDAQFNGHIDSQVQQALVRLYGLASINSEQFKDDPLFLFERYLHSVLFNQIEGFSLNGQWLYKMQQQKEYYLLPLMLTESAFDTHYQQKVKEFLLTLNKVVNTEHGELLGIGAITYAEQGFSQSKKEMSTVGLGGLVGIVLLLLITFRSVTPLAGLLMALSSSLLFSISLTLWWFGSIHILALLFSSAIIGISADYGFHFFAGLYMQKIKSKDIKKVRYKVVQRIFTGLTLGMLTSVSAYFLFVWAGLDILSQVSVLALLGLPSMYLTVILLLPFSVRYQSLKQPSHAIQKLVRCLLHNPLAKYCAPYLFRYFIIFPLMVIAVIVLYLAPTNDDVRALQSLPEQTVQQENLLRQLFNRPYVSDYAVLIGDKLNNIVKVERALLNQHPQLFINKVLVSEMLPDAKQQEKNHTIYQTLYTSPPVKKYASNVSNQIRLDIKQFAPLNLNAIAELPTIKQRFSEQLIALPNKQWAVLLPMSHVNKAVSHSLLQMNSKNNGVQVHQINPTQDMSAHFAQYRQQLGYCLFIIALLLVCLGVWRYGRQGITIVLLPVLSALITLILIVGFGQDISLFNVLAMLLLLGMGLDYVIFLAETEEHESVMLSLVLSCVTTILSFGLLALSETTAVATFGMTAALGITLILLLAPIVIYRIK